MARVDDLFCPRLESCEALGLEGSGATRVSRAPDIWAIALYSSLRFVGRP